MGGIGLEPNFVSDYSAEGYNNSGKSVGLRCGLEILKEAICGLTEEERAELIRALLKQEKAALE